MSSSYRGHIDLPKRTTPDKVLHDKTFNVAKNPKYYGYQRGLPPVVYKCFNGKTSNTNKEIGNNSDVVSGNKQLTKE